MEAAEAPVIRMGQTMAPIARLAISGGRSRRRGEGAAIGDGPSRGFGEKQNCLIACREVQFSFGEGITRSKGCERDKRGGGAKTHRDSPKVKPVSKITSPARRSYIPIYGKYTRTLPGDRDLLVESRSTLALPAKSAVEAIHK